MPTNPLKFVDPYGKSEMTTPTSRYGIAVQRIQIPLYFPVYPGEQVRVCPTANGFSISAKDGWGRWVESSEIYSAEQVESMIDFTLSQAAKDLWDSFFKDMTALVTEFFDFVEAGDKAAAHLILKVWLLGYEEACTLKSEDRLALEGLLDKCLAETVNKS